MRGGNVALAARGTIRCRRTLPEQEPASRTTTITQDHDHAPRSRPRRRGGSGPPPAAGARDHRGVSRGGSGRRHSLQLARAARRRRPHAHRRRRAGAVAVRRVVQPPAARAATTYGYLRWEILAAFINGADAAAPVGLDRDRGGAAARGSPSRCESGLMLAVAVGGHPGEHRRRARSFTPRATQPESARRLPPRRGRPARLRRHGRRRASRALDRVARRRPDRVAFSMTLLIVRGAWRLVRESVDVLLESTPSHISVGKRAQAARGHPRHRVGARPARLDGDLGRRRDERPRDRARAGAAPARIGARS